MRDAVASEPLDEDVAPVLSSPHERALRVVDPPLRDGSPGQLRQVRGGAHVIGVEMRDDDAVDGGAVE